MDRRVLLVDDDVLVQMLVTAVLEAEGWQVEVAGSLAEARAALAAGQPRVVVLDAQLPDGDGLALLHAVASATHVVLHSGREVAAPPPGVDAVLSKLGDPGRLVGHLATL